MPNLQAKSASRQQRFRAAIALSGKEMGDFAHEHGVTRAHLFYVLRGSRKGSEKLERAIDEFIADHLA